MDRSEFRGAPLEVRYWAKVHRAGADVCWLWTGWLDLWGYGRFRIGDRRIMAHRVAYELEVGPVPIGLVVMHSCDVPACVNPAHLSVGTMADNNDDKMRKGRHRCGHVSLRGERAGNAKLTWPSVRAIRRQFKAGVSRAQLARDFGVSWNQIDNVVKERCWMEAYFESGYQGEDF